MSADTAITPEVAMSTTGAELYDAHFYAWANEQAALLRAGRLAEADIENIAEEIESMGRSEKRELVNRTVSTVAAPAEVAIPTSSARK